MMTNPYPGLRPFEYAENHLFFGREGHAQKLASRLEQNHFVAVVGSSGSGKSSIVRAGLLLLLYGGRMFGSSSKWQISLMRPGDTPIHNLATSLVHPEKFDDFGLYNEKDPVPPQNEHKIGIVESILRRSGVGLIDHLKTADLEDGENLLIVVDQFEEFFRFKEKMRIGHLDEATAFVKLLLEATSNKQNRIYIIITMRSDFLGDCAEFRGLPEAINDGQYLVSRMTRNQLRSSIESPANVIAPDGKKYKLDFQKIISSKPSKLGSNIAQWRIKKNEKGEDTPIALIIPIEVFEDPKDPEKKTHYISISKITGNSICITDIVEAPIIEGEPAEESYKKARELAEDAINRPCKKAKESTKVVKFNKGGTSKSYQGTIEDEESRTYLLEASSG